MPVRRWEPFGTFERDGVLHLCGEVDLEVAGQLTELLRDHLARSGDRAVVDMSGVTFIDSTALQALLQMAAAAGPTCVVVLARPSHVVRRVLDLTGVAVFFAVEPTEP